MSLIQFAHGKFYSLLKAELETCMKEGSFQKAVENCFLTAGNYWSELRATVAEYKFQSVDDEMEFFKQVKPLFTSELEYYSLLYHTLLFCPNDVDEQKRFWQREARRLDEFKAQNADFLDYYHSGRKDLDGFYYRRAHEIGAVEEEHESYDGEPRSRTSHDHLISKLWALERYHDYVQNKLNEIDQVT
jgi:hypothetical protein